LFAIDFKGLEIAQGSAENRGADAASCCAFHKIANGVFTFGGAPFLHIHQQRGPVGRFGLGKQAPDDARDIRRRRVPLRGDNARALIDNGRTTGFRRMILR
jgi:hypothetical protein